jgi:plasmid stabilization system protein ParE
MAAAYRVLLTATALADLEGIARYIRRDSPQNAATTAGKILEAIDSLESMPGRFRRAGSSRKRRTPIHSMVVRPYIVYYRLEESAARVYVLNVRHGKRRQPRRFE